mmetsp:Transcript_84306/g.236987  ORF Transcript_84306/g.236987 Transcript_84306/m.236987 type:complete len:321 (+) Transcript_84306:2458-3420(+)
MSEAILQPQPLARVHGSRLVDHVLGVLLDEVPERADAAQPSCAGALVVRAALALRWGGIHLLAIYGRGHMPQDQHPDCDRTHDVPGWRPEQAEQSLHGLQPHDLLGVAHAGTELPQQGREVCHQQTSVHGAAEGGDDVVDSQARLGVHPDILVPEPLMHRPHGAVQQLAQSVRRDLGSRDRLQTVRHARGEVCKRCHTALPRAAVEATRPTVAEECNERGDEVQSHLVEGLRKGERLPERRLALLQRDGLFRPGARGLDIEELDALALCAGWGVVQSLEIRGRITVHRVVALLIHVACPVQTCAWSQAVVEPCARTETGR